ncbi:MAG: hypothetical protein KDC80_19210 [Saprospiraceae bacterium]|nr:hypothetical protein [Saprospiraceae bacterium]
MNFKRFYRFLLMGLCCLAFSPQGKAQDFTWWNSIHNWDGHTHWSRYIKLAPGFMGPNALPVPEINKGKLGSESSLQTAWETHFNPGDRTSNIYTRLYLPLATNKVGLSLELIPYERYHLNTTTRDARRVRDYDGTGSAFGDLYLGTHIQLLRNRRKLPDISVSINLKTASGNGLNAARFTDTPGYFFDLSMGKSFSIHNSVIDTIRPYTMLGLYVWQTYQIDHYQNDCFLYGFGFDIESEKFIISNALTGYSGYIGDGDRPLVYRLTLQSQFEKYPNLSVRFQEGLSDFPYTSWRFSLIFKL